MASPRPIIVVEDDRFLRLVQIILDPATPTERLSAFTHFMAHDEPNFRGWCQRLRDRLAELYPAEVRLVAAESDLRATLAGAQVVVVENFPIAEKEILAAARLQLASTRLLANAPACACLQSGGGQTSPPRNTPLL
jgi:hypothetical protein